jgi:hypothetical protein
MDTTALAVIGVLTIIRAINISSRNAAFCFQKTFLFFSKTIYKYNLVVYNRYIN